MTYPTTNDDDDAEMMSRMWGLHTDLLQIPFELGEPLKRWTKIVNAMIEKIPGKPYLHKLRVIHLIEADYNPALKSVYGRQLLWHCEEGNAFDEAQGGSQTRKRHR